MAELRAAIDTTFQLRATHAVPLALPDPADVWTEPYKRMAIEEDLRWRELPELVVAVRAFLEPMLARRSGTWDAGNPSGGFGGANAASGAFHERRRPSIG